MAIGISQRGFYKKPSYGGREVTLIEMEAIEALFHGCDADEKRLGIKFAPGDARRNIVTSGVPLKHLTDRDFWIGTVLMRGTRLFEHCKHLDDLTQPEVMSGLIRRGGLRAEILNEGVIHVGDTVQLKTS